MFVYILTKPIAEVQHRLFKDKLENKGKLYARVLFLLARNINYVGYILWQSGVTSACGGPVLGALIAAFFTWDFATQTIAQMEEYFKDKHGDHHKRIEKEVQDRLLSGIY